MNRERYTRRQARDYDERNYHGDAVKLIKGLDEYQLYELYEIVNEKLNHGTTMKREKELLAVKKVIEDKNGLDRDRLRRTRQGRSEMAKEGSRGEKAGRTTVHRKESIMANHVDGYPDYPRKRRGHESLRRDHQEIGRYPQRGRPLMGRSAPRRTLLR